MGGINMMKVLVGGVVAGLVINLGQTLVHAFLFAEASAALTESMGAPEPDGTTIGIFWALGFAIGITMIGVYAAIRPRCGPGVGTAIGAAIIVFVLGELIPSLFWMASGIFGFGQYLPFLISTFVLLCVSAVAGAALYSEDEAGEAA
ncbi:MAG: hypothetical protein IH849_06965 [Acidobacteria bacterium]|nr:hypothetical protein [Acidobacteriota bacterium]